MKVNQVSRVFFLTEALPRPWRDVAPVRKKIHTVNAAQWNLMAFLNDQGDTGTLCGFQNIKI